MKPSSAKSKGRSEKEIENAILDYLALVPGFEAWKVDTVGVYDAQKGVRRKRSSKHRYKGVPDIIGFYKGRFWAVEVKTPKRRSQTTPEQAEFLKLATHNGQVAMVATSVEDVEKKIEEVENETAI